MKSSGSKIACLVPVVVRRLAPVRHVAAGRDG